MLKLISNCHKNQKMWNKAVDNYIHALEYVHDCCSTQKMCNRLSVHILLQYNLFLNTLKHKKYLIKLLILVFLCLILFQITTKLKENYDKVVSKEPFILKYCLDRCDKAVDAFLPTLKIVLDWFVTNKTLEKLDDAIFSNYDIVFVNEGSDNVILTMVLILHTLVILTLMMITLMMMWDLLFMLNLWLGVIDINKTRNAKKI